MGVLASVIGEPFRESYNEAQSVQLHRLLVFVSERFSCRYLKGCSRQPMNAQRPWLNYRKPNPVTVLRLSMRIPDLPGLYPEAPYLALHDRRKALPRICPRKFWI